MLQGIPQSYSKEPDRKRGSKRRSGNGVVDRDEFFILLAETFKTLGDTSRIKIVWLLSEKERSVGELSEMLSMSQPAVSHHLRTLRQLKLVAVRKDGTSAYYSLDDHHINTLLREGTEHVEELMR
jgi:ArsR family transcriptional regulator